MTLKELKELAFCAAQRQAYTTYAVEDVTGLLHSELNALAKDYYAFQRNQNDIFEMIAEVSDLIVPKRVDQIFSMFAEVRNSPNGQKVVFTQKVGKNRAKKFLTQVGLSGTYETFRLDKKDFTVSAHAIGGAAYLDFERLSTGDEEMADYMDVIVEGLTEATYGLIQKALRAALSATSRPSKNKYTGSSFDATEMQKLIAVVKSYSTGAVIFAPPEFIAAMGPDAIVPPTSAVAGQYSPADIAAIHDFGRVMMFRGTPIVEIPQSFTDETNTATQVDPQMAYILPVDGEKVVKVVMEGPTIVKLLNNRDNSMELQAYKKIGAAILTHHNWCIFQNTGITQTFTETTL